MSSSQSCGRLTARRVWIAALLLPVLAPMRAAADGPVFRPKDWAPESLRSDEGNDHHWYEIRGVGINLEGKKTLMGLSFWPKRDFGPTAPLPVPRSHGYVVAYGRMYGGDLVPLFGHLYRVSPVNVTPTTRRLFGLTRIADKEVPAGVRLREDCYEFPLHGDPAHQAPYIVGTLHDRRIVIGEIATPKTEKEPLRVKIGTLTDVEKDMRGREKDVVWTSVSVGDVVEIGGFRHKVANIVPPKGPQELQRGDARMLGCIELEWRPLDDASKP